MKNASVNLIDFNRLENETTFKWIEFEFWIVVNWMWLANDFCLIRESNPLFINRNFIH